MEPGLIYKKMIDILSDIDYIGKDKKNTLQNYNFRGIDDVYNELHAIFAKHRVFITPNVIRVSREERQSTKERLLIYTIVDVKFIFYAEDGSYVESMITGEAMDSGDKGCNKALSAAQKYALIQMLLIPTMEKKDPEDDSHELRPKNEKQEALSLIAKSTSIADLKQLKEMYNDLFNSDADIKAAAKKRHAEIII